MVDKYLHVISIEVILEVVIYNINPGVRKEENLGASPNKY